MIITPSSLSPSLLLTLHAPIVPVVVATRDLESPHLFHERLQLSLFKHVVVALVDYRVVLLSLFIVFIFILEMPGHKHILPFKLPSFLLQRPHIHQQSPSFLEHARAFLQRGHSQLCRGQMVHHCNRYH